MNPIIHKAGLAVLISGLMAAPAFAGMGGMAGGAGAQDGVGAQTVPNTASPDDLSGKTASGKTEIGHSQAELPNNDAGTPINKGPTGHAVDSPQELSPGATTGGSSPK